MTNVIKKNYSDYIIICLIMRTQLLKVCVNQSGGKSQRMRLEFRPDCKISFKKEINKVVLATEM